MLQEIDQNLWVAEQPIKYFGLNLRTRMTVIRLQSREIAIISPIRLNEQAIQQLNELGGVNHIIAPNLYHYMFANPLKEQYPNAVFWAAPGLKEKEPDLSIDQTLEEDPFTLSNELEYLFFEGFRTLVPSGFESLNECIFFHSATRTLIITDAAFNFDATFPWTTQLAARVSGIYDMLSPSRLEKLAITDKALMQKSVEKVLRWDFDRVVMAHGSIVEHDGKAAFAKAYQFVRQ